MDLIFHHLVFFIQPKKVKTNIDPIFDHPIFDSAKKS